MHNTHVDDPNYTTELAFFLALARDLREASEFKIVNRFKVWYTVFVPFNNGATVRKGEEMVSKSDAQELASQAIGMGAGALRGFLHHGQAEEWIVGSTDVNTWLGRYEGFELILLAVPIGERGTGEMKTCRTCGREYEGDTCSHCQTARKRLRGE
jgi:hypothetical protein